MESNYAQLIIKELKEIRQQQQKQAEALEKIAQHLELIAVNSTGS